MGVVISEERIYLDFDISVNDYQFNTVEPLLIIDSSLGPKKFHCYNYGLDLVFSFVMWTAILAECLLFAHFFWLLHYLSIE